MFQAGWLENRMEKVAANIVRLENEGAAHHM